MLMHPPFDDHHKEQIRLRSEQRTKELEERQSRRKHWGELSDPWFSFLSRECPDLESAKVFVHQWYSGTHPFSVGQQELDLQDGDGPFSMTMRAMAGTASRVLEGYDEDPDWPIGDYLTTEYGSELYNAM